MDTSPEQDFLEKLASGAPRAERQSHDIKVLARQAAGRFLGGDAKSLQDAIVDISETEKLSPTQVRRLTESANQATWQEGFRDGGDTELQFTPANPTEILGAMDKQPEAIQAPELDYAEEPPAAHVPDIDLKEAFGVKDDTEDYNPLTSGADEQADLQKAAHVVKLAGSDREKLASHLVDAGESFYNEFRRAVFDDDQGLLRVCQTLIDATSDEDFGRDLVKVAVARLERETNYKPDRDVELQKLAELVVVDDAHPLLVKLAELEQLSMLFYSTGESLESAQAAHASAVTAYRAAR